MGCCCCVCKQRYIKGGTLSLHTFPRDENRRKLWESKITKKDFKATNNIRICSKHFTEDCFDTNKLGGRWLKKDAIPTLFEFMNNNSEESRNLPVKRKLITGENINSHKDLSVEKDAEQQSLKKFCYMDNYKENHISAPIIINIYSERHHKPFSESKFETEENEDIHRILDFSAVNDSEKQSTKSYRYMGDFEESDMYSPTKAVLYFNISSHFKKKKLAQLKFLRDSNRSLRRCVASLKQQLEDIKKKGLVTQAVSSGSQLMPPGSATEVKKEVLQKKNISQNLVPSP